jgi:hypothetical protein
MDKEPWDLPIEEASKPILEALIAKYKAGEQARELGICCSQMAHLLKHIGPMDEAALYGQKAIWFLRQTDDKKELARAMRVACVPFTDGPHKEYLEESLTLSREIGDREEEAWTMYRLTRAMPTPGISMETIMTTLEHGSEEDSLKLLDEMKGTDAKTYRVEDALSVFEEIGNSVGIAMCLVSLGVERKPSDRVLFDRPSNCTKKQEKPRQPGKPE